MKGIIGCDSKDISKLAKYNADFGITQKSKFENEFFDELWMDNSTNKNINDSQYRDFFLWLKEDGNLYIPYETDNQAVLMDYKPIMSGFMFMQVKDLEGRSFFTRQEVIQHNIDFLTSIFDKEYLFIVEFIEKKYPIVGYQENPIYCPNGYYVCTKLRYA